MIGPMALINEPIPLMQKPKTKRFDGVKRVMVGSGSHTTARTSAPKITGSQWVTVALKIREVPSNAPKQPPTKMGNTISCLICFRMSHARLPFENSCTAVCKGMATGSGNSQTMTSKSKVPPPTPVVAVSADASMLVDIKSAAVII